MMAAHDRELHDALKKLDSSRDKQGETLRQKLAERRRKQEQELRDRQAKEVGNIDSGSSMDKQPL